MSLILRVQSYRNQPAPAGLYCRFSDAGGTLGRGADNDLVLDDPGKYISRVHAKVVLRDGQYWLADSGSNPSVVNDRPLGNGREIALGDGDSIVIGDYLLLASMADDKEEAPVAEQSAAAPPAAPSAPTLPLFVAPPVAPTVPLPPLEYPAARPPAAAPLAGLPDALAGASILDSGPRFDGGVASADPLGLDLFAGQFSAPMPSLNPAREEHLRPGFRGAESDHVSPEFQALVMPTPSVAPAPMAIPDDYDPLADFLARRGQPGAPAAPVDAVKAGLAAPAPVFAVPLSPAASMTPAPAGSDATAAPLPAPVPAALAAAAPAAPLPPPVAAIPMPAPAAVGAAAAPGPSTTDGAVLQALLDGLGLPQLHSKRPPAELAGLLGQMLRAATAGTMEVLMARALTKRESNIDMTMIAPRANNPLKFFPDPDSALGQMLDAATPGYLAPVAAIDAAFDDLKAHELAVIAGMRAALAAVVQRFDPVRIEQRLAEPGRFDKLLPASRKARMWDRLVELYGELARDADEDLQRLFGEKFSVAYEEQVARLRGGGP